VVQFLLILHYGLRKKAPHLCRPTHLPAAKDTSGCEPSGVFANPAVVANFVRTSGTPQNSSITPRRRSRRSRRLTAPQKMLLSAYKAILTFTMMRPVVSFSSLALQRSTRAASTRAFRPTLFMKAKEGQAEVVLVGCGAPNRGMGWYHGIQVCFIGTWASN
jgi:hypothetical protein